MPKPAVKPSSSSFIYFRPLALPRTVSLVHKVAYGNMDLQLSGQGEELGILHATWADKLGPRMRWEHAAKSAALRVSVPKIDMSAPFAESESNAREALGAALELLDWYTRVFQPTHAV